jgi:hypothetical protein
VVDECHRGSAAEDSAWRDILDYFSSATQIGLTATPKETKDVSNIHYFGEPVYTYSCAGHRRRLPRALQGRPHRPRQGPARLAPQPRADRQARPADRRPHLQPEGHRPQPGAGEAHRTRGRQDHRIPQGHRPLRQDHRLLRGHRPRRAHAPGAGPTSTPTHRREPQVRHAHHRRQQEGKAELDNFIDPEKAATRSSPPPAS